MSEELTPSVTAERMLKMFDDGAHWVQGNYEQLPSQERGIPEAWCLVGGYMRVRYGSYVDAPDPRAYEQPFLRKLAALIRRLDPDIVQEARVNLDEDYTESSIALDEAVVFTYNDAEERTYDDIRSLLEEVRNEQAECAGDGDGTAPDGTSPLW